MAINKFMYAAALAINMSGMCGQAQSQVKTVEVQDLRVADCYALSVTQPGDDDQTYRRQFSAAVNLDSYGNLYFDIKGFLAECEGEHLMDATVNGNLITLAPYITNPSADPCFCRRNMSFMLPTIKTKPGDYVVRWEGQPKENGIIPLLFGDKQEVTSGFYSDEVKIPLDSENIVILHNPGDANHDPFFAHLFIYTDIDGTLSVNINGIGSFGNQTKIGTLRTEGAKVFVTPEDIEIPSEFWGLNMGVASMNPAKMLGKDEILLYDFSDTETSEVYVRDFLKGELKNCVRIATYSDDEYNLAEQGKNSSERHVWRDLRHDFASETFSASHHRNFGAFGSEIASNPIYPIYELEEGVVPTSFSCVGVMGCDFHGSIPMQPSYFVNDYWRDDPSFNTASCAQPVMTPESSSLFEGGLNARIEGNVLEISGEGNILVNVYLADGALVSSAEGVGEVNVVLPAPAGQPIIVSASNAEGHQIRKIMR